MSCGKGFSIWADLCSCTAQSEPKCLRSQMRFGDKQLQACNGTAEGACDMILFVCANQHLNGTNTA